MTRYLFITIVAALLGGCSDPDAHYDYLLQSEPPPLMSMESRHDLYDGGEFGRIDLRRAMWFRANLLPAEATYAIEQMYASFPFVESVEWGAPGKPAVVRVGFSDGTSPRVDTSLGCHLIIWLGAHMPEKHENWWPEDWAWPPEPETTWKP